MLILEIAIGIVLGFILLVLIAHPTFWKIVGIVLGGIILIILACVVWNFREDIFDAIMIGLGFLVLISPVLLLERYFDLKRFRNFTITVYKKEKKATVKSGNELLHSYETLLPPTVEYIENTFFKRHWLKKDGYSIKMIEEDDEKQIWQYVKENKSKK